MKFIHLLIFYEAEVTFLYFPSKKSISLGIIIWGSIVLFGLIYIFGEEPFGFQTRTYKSIIGLILYLIVVYLFLWLWFRTGYKITAGYIKIKSGPLKYTVKIDDIRKLKLTKSFLAAPALSMDRIEIHYNKYNTVMVSAENKEDFIKQISTKNPTISIE